MTNEGRKVNLALATVALATVGSFVILGGGLIGNGYSLHGDARGDLIITLSMLPATLWGLACIPFVGRSRWNILNVTYTTVSALVTIGAFCSLVG